MLRLNFMFSWDVCIYVVCIQVKGICRQMQPQPSQRTRITNEHRNEKYLRVNGHFFWTMLLLLIFFVSSRWFCHISSYFLLFILQIFVFHLERSPRMFICAKQNVEVYVDSSKNFRGKTKRLESCCCWLFTNGSAPSVECCVNWHLWGILDKFSMSHSRLIKRWF